MGQFFIFLMMFFLLSSCEKKYSSNNSTITLQKLVNKNVWNTTDSLLQNGVINQNPSKSIMLLEDLRKEFNQKDSATYAYLNLYIAQAYYVAGSLDSMQTYANQALSYFELHPNFIKPLIICYNVLGNSFYYGKEVNLFKANYYTTKAASLCSLREADSLIKTKHKIKIYQMASLTNIECYQSEQGIKYAKKYLQLADKYKKQDALEYVEALQVLGSAYAGNKKLDSAYYYLKKGQFFLNNLLVKDNISQEIVEINMNNAWRYYYIKKQDFQNALKYSLKVTKSQEYANYTDPLISSYISNFDIYTNLHQYKEAFFYMNKAKSILLDTNNIDALTNYIKIKTHYNLLYGNKKETEKLFLYYDKSQEAYYDKERLKMFSAIESEYNLVEKERNIKKLNDEKKASEQALKEKTTFLLITALIALLALAVLAVFYLYYRQEKLKAKAQNLSFVNEKMALEQRLLLSQMNPHFMFNALSAIQKEVLVGNAKVANRYLTKYANLTRLILENSQYNYLLIEKEVKILKNYLDLQQINYPDKFDFELTVYENYEDDDLVIPPMLIQPFLENAVEHGFQNIDYKGKLKIDLSKDERYFYCKIEDNGKGFTENLLKNKKSLSTEILQKRLRIIEQETGYKTSFSITNKEQETGVIIALKIPYKIAE